MQSIGAFWAWWQSSGAADTAAAIEAGEPERMVSEIGSRVAAVHPRLGWELTPGRTSRHVLVVSSEGDAHLRAVARRWRRAAPAADATWDYSDVRLPAASPEGLVLGVDDVDVDVNDVQVSARVDGAAIDVGLFHPAFPDLPERQRVRVTFLLLDQVLGEEAVETWVGSVEALTTPPLDPVPLATLPDVVDQVRDLHLDEGGRPTWMLLEGQDPKGLPVIASAQVPLKAATAPHLDTYVGVAVPYTERTDGGLPDVGSLGPLRQLEDHLAGRLSESGRVVAHQSHDGVRILHIYVDGATPAAEQVRAAVGGWDQGTVEVEVKPDPAWDEVAHLRP